MNEKMQGHAWEVDGHKVQCLTCGMVQTQETAGTKCGVYPLEPTPPASQESAGEAVALDCYDAGLLSDFGGGNVEWWQDYIRAELGRAHDFYQSQAIATLTAEVSRLTGELERSRKECAGEAVALDYYDAGLLGDGGGGDVDWWQDYMRDELGRAHEFYQSQAIATLTAEVSRLTGENATHLNDWRDQVQKTCAALKQRNDAEENLAASEARVGVLTEALVPHIADLRRCAAILRTSELAEKFIGTADEFDRAAEELNAAIGSASHD